MDKETGKKRVTRDPSVKCEPDYIDSVSWTTVDLQT